MYRRKKRQLNYIAKQLKKVLPHSYSYNILVARAKKLLTELRSAFSFTELKKLSLPAFLFIGMISTTNAGAQTFLPPVQNAFGLDTAYSIGSPALVDLDNDGDLDMIHGEYYGNYQYYQNTGTASAPSFTTAVQNPFGLMSTSLFAWPTFADLDADGDKDLMLGEYYGFLRYFENTGTASAPAFTNMGPSPFGTTTVSLTAHPALADIDSDGDFDLFVGEYTGNIMYFQNTGTASVPSFTTPIANPFGITPVGSIRSPFFTDMDSDGDLDLLVGEYPGNFQYYQNTGTASSPAFAAPLNNPFNLTAPNTFAFLSMGDLDADGDKDLLIGEGLGVFQYYENGTPLKVTALNANSLVRVFPNPTADLIHIDCKECPVIKTEIFDVIGKNCAVYPGDAKTISLKELESGTYFIKITFKDKTDHLVKIQKL
jgi:hypothetical protein